MTDPLYPDRWGTPPLCSRCGDLTDWLPSGVARCDSCGQHVIDLSAVAAGDWPVPGEEIER